MGPYSARALAAALVLSASPALGQSPGWSYSHLPGEGDRASLGCATGTTKEAYTCIAVRCEDDFSVGLHLYTSRPAGAPGRWVMTVDREDHAFDVVADDTSYGARIEDDDGWLLERLEQGTFVYLRHAEDAADGFAHVSLAGSYRAIREALYFCAPRVAPGEQNAVQDVSVQTQMEKINEPTPVGTQ